MLSLFLASSVLYAGEFNDTMVAARKALQGKKYQKLEELLTKAERIAPKESAVHSTLDLSRIWLYRGIAKFYTKQDPIKDWRKALIMNPTLDWDKELLSNAEQFDIFLIIKDEVKTRSLSEVGIPEKYGRAKIYVDGVQKYRGDKVPQGNHLAQVKCPKGDIYGKWTNLKRAPKWIKFCPYKFNVLDMPKEKPKDEWAEFGPDFGGGDSTTTTETSTSTTATTPAPAPVQAGVWQRLNKPVIYVAGGSAVVASVLYGMALSDKSNYDDIDNKDIKSVDDLNKLRQSANTKVYTSAGFGGVAVGLYAYAFWKVKF